MRKNSNATFFTHFSTRLRRRRLTFSSANFQHWPKIFSTASKAQCQKLAARRTIAPQLSKIAFSIINHNRVIFLECCKVQISVGTFRFGLNSSNLLSVPKSNVKDMEKKKWIRKRQYKKNLVERQVFRQNKSIVL